MTIQAKATHTPGPWNFHPAYPLDGKPLTIEGSEYCPGAVWTSWDFRIAQGDKIIATVECSTANNGGWPHVSSPDEARANAHLFVAAPGLLKALEEIERLAENIPTENATAFNVAMKIADAARAAIAQAVQA